MLNTSNSQSLFLNHVLHVPFITKNLLSISKLLADNPVTVEFLGDLCVIKARNTGKILLEGVAKGGLYRVSSHAAAHSVFLSLVGQNKIQSLFACSPVFNSAQLSTVSSCELNKKSCLSVVTKGSIDVNLLHRRLGHPASYTLKTILKACNNSTAFNKVDSLKFCSACQYGKNHMLHFNSVETKTSAPLQLIYADLWGPSHVCSTQ